MNNVLRLRRRIACEMAFGVLMIAFGLSLFIAGWFAPAGFEAMPFGGYAIALLVGVCSVAFGTANIRTSLLRGKMRRAGWPEERVRNRTSLPHHRVGPRY